MGKAEKKVGVATITAGWSIATVLTTGGVVLVFTGHELAGIIAMALGIGFYYLKKKLERGEL